MSLFSYEVHNRVAEILFNNPPVNALTEAMLGDFLDALAEGFVPFLNEAMENNPMKAEYYLPTAVSRQLDRHRATARVLTCPDRWYGVTYHEDRAVVAKAMLRKAEEGEYPRPLWGKK